MSADGVRFELRARVADYAYVLRHSLGTVLRCSRPPAAYADGALAPVVLLPGIYERWTMMKPLADALNEAGHPVHIVATLGINLTPVAEAATLVHGVLESLDLRGVVLVAHSKGGLIGKRILAVEDTDSRVAALIAIATPFGGARLARWIPLRPVRTMIPGTAMLTELAGFAAGHGRVTSIYPRFDPHVVEGSRLEGAHNVEIDTIGHFRVLDRPATIAAVLAAAAV